ncbi:diacylglycerol lipase-alpha-like isoform X1 [Myxocyprinus asiaticus]|uniref:diacylglycerol lipase-alpha-like isoform X1 n=1 Tax=Myxocyprinus asiaticus TaxID=70543 RepID=UPI002221C00E|nr:diacylglycerol lipase-alpha-like isoform X1 [Myxocyprinus asiaticus]XP_051571085.1 diacylglycerol lipase-alpha-like isoform X1 [Myxocyprinus asiaticus]XP_051571093.1 diacylglycerol lipase-alpha-like isoform X1 [Myxocyprinus asiaticus]XP_051571102.1 diacylglycerol lipase-alpha-like isoform X1 [Myxocyprinus asiaticus]
MPGMVLFQRRWSVGSDDLVLPAFFLFILHCIWLAVLSVVLFGLPYSSEQSCSVTLVDHGRGYLGILVSCLICESAIMWLSMRGSILYTQPREAVQYVLYIRLAILLVELVYAVVGIAWLVQYYQPCSDITAKNLALGIVACNWLVIFSVCFTMMCTFDPTGRTFVKLKATRRRQRNLTTYTLRHRLEEGQASSWSRRLKFFMCCTRAQDTQSDAYSEVASLFAEFFRDLDIVPSDIIAGLVLLRQRQRAKRSAILDQANNDVLAFLSGMPVTRNTKYLDLKNSAEMAMYKEVCYYMLFAMAAYGWPMYLFRKPACGLCRLVSTCSCNTSVSGSRLSQSVTVEEDNCCGCNVLAIRRQFLDQDLKEVQIVYTSCHDAVYETPFFVAVDHAKKKVIISIRGTLSPKDALTDLTGDSERLPLEEQHGTWLGHKGMVYSAEYIKKKLEQEMILSQAFGRDLGKGTMHYGLVIVGHSLGAGAAAILSFLLRPQYPSLHCYAYSPPGGLLSEDAMEYSKDFITSVVLGKDLVPRIGLSQLEGFRRHLLEVLQKSDKPKWRIIAGGTKCIPKSELPLDDGPPLSEGVTPSNSRLWLHPSDLSIALSASTPLYPPGRVIHVVHNHPPETCCGQEEPTYSALWGDNKAFDEVIISPAMLNEHMPHVVMDGLNKVLENYNKGKTALLSAAKIMVSPTEVDLNPETIFLGASSSPQPTPATHHRRNSSVRSCARSEISLDGFSECPPPPVPVVLTGARERLAVELRERKAPLAIMESLSDAESVYSLDSRRSSAALRGSPCLGSLPFPLDAPIPEENPSLSSRTELLAADSLSQGTVDHELGEAGPYCPTLELAVPSNDTHYLSVNSCNSGHFSPLSLGQTTEDQPASQGMNFCPSSGTPAACQQSAVHNSQESCKLSEMANDREVEMEERQGEVKVDLESGRSQALQPVPPLSNGTPSQAVLEFAQYLDSLFRLDGSSSSPLELSDAESESGQGSYSQTEGQLEDQRVKNSDKDRQLMARATLEPNLVPKPPRTFADSADLSSGISLSPSFPLSSSGDFNDLSPPDGAIPINHSTLRTSAAMPNPKETALSSMV